MWLYKANLRHFLPFSLYFSLAKNSSKPNPIKRMRTLSNDWITEGLIDVEYKSYILLAYLAEVKARFNEQKLYPSLADLVRHYQNILTVKTGREQMKQAFPKTLDAADWEQWKLEYREKVEDNDFLEIMDEIIEYSIPRMRHHLDEGKDLYQYVENHIQISPVGLASLSNLKGYFFLCAPPKTEAKVYEYSLTQVHLPDGNYRALHVTHLDDVRLSYSNTFENLKIDLVRRYKADSTPATYLVESEVLVPFEESLLPVAKRRLVEHLVKEG